MVAGGSLGGTVLQVFGKKVFGKIDSDLLKHVEKSEGVSVGDCTL